LACGMRTSEAMAKRTPRLDLACQIGPNTLWVRILMVVGGWKKLKIKNIENWRRLGLWNENQQCYGQTDTTVGFSTSNRFTGTLGTTSNCS